MLSSSSKPKFAFNLTINDLTNVPEINGSCYIELQIRDGTRRSFHTSNINNGSSGSNNSNSNGKNSQKSSTNTSNTNGIKSTPMTTSRTFLNKFDEFASSLGSSGSKGNSSSSSSSSAVSGNISATTSRKKLHNFKCNFNYKLSCNLKFNIKKKGNIIANKYLLLKIFYVNNDSGLVGGGKSNNSTSTYHHHHHTQITELGKVDINLSEYLNFDEPITTKYLLNDSKVNSILGVTIGLNELSSTFDFHTQLQIQDSNSSISGGSTSISNNTNSMLSRPTSTTISSRRNNFNVPQFERKHVFTGIGNVLGDNNSFGQPQNDTSRPSTPTSQQQQQQQQQLPTIGETETKNGSRIKSSNDQDGWKIMKNQNPNTTTITTTTNGNINGNDITQTAASQQLQQAMMDPIVSQLYCKILESSWDPELYPILDYTPEQCIEDIFNNPDNKYGCNLKLKQLYESKLNDESEELKELDNSYRELNGLISESKYRSDLKSWNINVDDLPSSSSSGGGAVITGTSTC